MFLRAAGRRTHVPATQGRAVQALVFKAKALHSLVTASASAGASDAHVTATSASRVRRAARRRTVAWTEPRAVVRSTLPDAAKPAPTTRAVQCPRRARREAPARASTDTLRAVRGYRRGVARAAAPDRDGKDDRAAPTDRHGPRWRRGSGRPHDRDAELRGLVDRVLGNAVAGEGDEALGQEVEEVVVAAEGRGPSVAVPVGLAHHLVRAVPLGPLRGDLLDAGSAAVD